MHFQLRNIRDAHSDFGTCVQWINESQVITCGDDHRLNVWNIFNFVQVKTIKLPDDFFVTDLAIFSSNQANSALSSGKRSLNQSSSSSLQQNQLKVILSCTDGKFHFLNITLEKIEKSIDAHQGAVTCLKLSRDESAILTCSEDGQIKVWSKTGLLRNTIAIESSPIHCALWSSDHQERILYSANDQLHIRPLTPNSKTIKWTAHKGYVIRCVDWNLKFKLILSSDELGHIKLWDSNGNHLKTVEMRENLIASSLSWSRDGERWASGGHNFILLGDRKGYLLSIQHLNEKRKLKTTRPSNDESLSTESHDDQVGKQTNNVSLNEILSDQLNTAQSLMKISWLNNSIVSISTAGQLFYGCIVNEIVQWSSYSLLILDSKRILLKNILIDYEQELEFNDAIMRYSLKFGYLVVLSINQCYVYPLLKVDPLDKKPLNSTINPTIIQLKDTNFFMILQSSSQFALVSQSSNIVLFNYQGRQMFVFKLGYNKRLEEELNSSMISLSEDCLAFRDPLDPKVIRFFDSSNGIELLRNKEINTGGDRRSSATKTEFKHEQDVVTVKLNTSNCSSNERKCAFIDKNLDLYITLVRPTSIKNYTTIKLINMCTSVQWNEHFDLLAAIEQNTKLNIFIYPQAAFLDSDLLRLSTVFKEYDSIASQTDYQHLDLISFQRDQIKLTNELGSFITNMINPFYILLYSYVNDNKFDRALKLCRLNPKDVNSYSNEKRPTDMSLWAAFTSMALNKRNLDMAEIGYAAVEIFERVIYIKNIKKIYDQLASKLGANEPVNSTKMMSAEALKNAEISLLCGSYLEAETILLNAGFIVRCLFMHLNLFHWIDAVQIAKKYDHHCTDDLNKFLIKAGKGDQVIEEEMLSRIVFSYRLTYLQRYGVDETDSIFLRMAERLSLLDSECVEMIQREQYSFRFNIKKM